MIQLLYISTATREIDAVDLAQISDVAAARNAPDNITGLLCFNGRNFMQLVEGQRPVIEALMQRLHLDDRHSGIVVMHEGDILKRDFSDWHMRVASVSASDSVRLEEMETLLPVNMAPALRSMMLAYGDLK